MTATALEFAAAGLCWTSLFPAVALLATLLGASGVAVSLTMRHGGCGCLGAIHLSWWAQGAAASTLGIIGCCILLRRNQGVVKHGMPPPNHIGSPT